MNILAIETSCDDTCVAITQVLDRKRPSFKILSNIVSSQAEIHRKWGGVYPALAKREHQKNLTPILIKALKVAGLLKKNQNSKSKKQNHNSKLNIRAHPLGSRSLFISEFKKFRNNKILKEILMREGYLFRQLKSFLSKYQKPKVDLIAVTIGPGLEPCLWIGVNFAKALSYFWNLPIIPVNHIEAHIFANWLTPIGEKSKIKNQKSKMHIKNELPTSSGGGGYPRRRNKKIKFPAICLVVSGGHTQLILMKDFGKYEILGETRDDAAGECFDKVARILGLGYPGGPAIAEEAEKFRKDKFLSLATAVEKYGINFPRPMIYQKNYDFSFSGLKTAVLYKIKNERLKIKDKKYIQAISAQVQQAVIDVLIVKTIRAIKEYKAKTVILGGGVAANNELRKQFAVKLKSLNFKVKLLVPAEIFCTDNAAMVGRVAYFYWSKQKKYPWQKVEVKANLRL